ncbi:MAG: hypothetical protein WCG75_03130 [Armatimonadota bacterium]
MIVQTTEFLLSETLHDGIVLGSEWQSLENPTRKALIVNVRFYIDEPDMKERCFLSIEFDDVLSTETPWPKFDIFDFDLVNESPLAFSMVDSVTGESVNVLCKDSHIHVDEVFLEYLRKYDRPILKCLQRVTNIRDL